MRIRQFPSLATACAALLLVAACGSEVLLGPDAAQGTDGRFHLGLLPGIYHLVPESGNFPTATEQDAVVEAGSYTDVVINFDSGIR